MSLIHQMGDLDLFLDGDSNPTPHLCVMFKSHKTLKFLVGVDEKCCRVRNQLNQTPLMVAASNGNLNAIHIILGAPYPSIAIAECDHDGYNALHLAVLNEHFNTAELLLNYGADPNALTSQNHSVFRLIEEIKDPIKKLNFKHLFKPFKNNIKLQSENHNNNSLPALTVVGSTQPPPTTSSKKKSSSKSKRDKKQNRQIKQASKQSHQHLDKLKSLIEQKKSKEEQLKLSKQKKQISEEESEIEKHKQLERRKKKRQKLEEQKKKLRANKKAQLENQSNDPNSTSPSDLNNK